MLKSFVTLFTFFLLIALSVNAQVVLDTPVWKVDAGSVSYLGTAHTERGGGYNQATDHVLVVSRIGGVNIIALDAATGDSVNALDVTGISGGIYPFNEIAITEDGQIFGANLVLDATSSNVKIYRWENESSTPVTVYDGLVASGRFGDGCGVMGSGNDVDFLLTGTGNSVFAKFHWDGSTFTGPTVVSLAEARASGGFAVVAGEDSAWTNRAGFAAAKINLMDGQVGPQVSTGILSSGHNDVAYIEKNGKKFLASGPNGSTEQKFRIVDVTNSGMPMVVAVTDLLGPNSNSNATGFAAFDPMRENLIVLGTNNAVAAYPIADLFALPPAPPMDLAANPYGMEAMLSWTLDRPDVQVGYHDNIPVSGFYQDAAKGYGVIFDVSMYSGATLEQLDFHHYGYEFQAGPYDYKLYVYDWTNQTVLAEIDNLVAKDAFAQAEWEIGVDLGSIPQNTQKIGVFLQGKTIDSFGDAWPTLSTDNTVPSVTDGQVIINDLTDPFNNAQDPGNASLGNFLMDLWLNTPSGERVLASRGPEEGEFSPVSVSQTANMEKSDAGRGLIPDIAITPKPLGNAASLESVTGFNIYRGPDAGSLTLYDNVNSTATNTMFYYVDAAPLADSMYYYGVSVVADNGMESDISSVDYYHPAFYDIATARADNDGDFFPDLDGEVVTVMGIVVTPNYGSGVDYYIQDTTAGINLFGFDAMSGLELGDEVYATGEITTYRGKTELMLDDTMHVVLLSTGNDLPDAMELTLADINESVEGLFVKVNGLDIVDPSEWPTAGNNANVRVTDGVDTAIVRIDKDTDIDENAAPTETFSLYAVIDQFTYSSPPDDGYQLRPRFYTDFMPASGITPGTPLPTEFMVHQNYPNPFNPSTTLQFDLPQPADVSIVVYNAVGQKVKTLVNGKQDAGYHNVVWDGTNESGQRVASGVYIFNAVLDKHVTSGKMLLVK